MNRKHIFIRSAVQISMQKPLSEQWMKEPVFKNDEGFARSQDPNFRDLFPANEARRMGRLMKRALVTALQALENAGVKQPEAVVTGTCYGSMLCTENFLQQMTDNKEDMLSPTSFIQSTHNTTSSAIAIKTKSTAYNTTYSHGAMSFDWTLLDACMQMRLGMVKNALVGGQDEMIEPFYEMLRMQGIVGKTGMVPCGETAMEMFLTTSDNMDNLCELIGIRIMHRPTVAKVKAELDRLLQNAGANQDEIDAVMTGVNGNLNNDMRYEQLLHEVLPNVPHLHFKHVFGESPTASAYGVYVSAHILKKRFLPQFLLVNGNVVEESCPHVLLVINCTKDFDISFVLLKSCC